MRSIRPDLKITMMAGDISKDALEFARKGIYSLNRIDLQDPSIFERLTDEEMREMFEAEADGLRIKSWLREAVSWHVIDAGDPTILNVLGPQDIVVANRFLCHMDPEDAERCLRNIAQLVDRGGYLFVSGIDLDVRAKVAQDLKWSPVLDSMEDIHEGDPCLRNHWPWHYTGLEPFDKKRQDWKVRYASVFAV